MHLNQVCCALAISFRSERNDCSDLFRKHLAINENTMSKGDLKSYAIKYLHPELSY